MKYFAAPSFACVLCGTVHTSPSVSYLLPEDMNAWECSLVGPSCKADIVGKSCKAVVSPLMRQYLTHWLHWAETGEGFEDGHSYDEAEGLCYNAEIYCGEVNGDADSDSLYKELLDLFIADGLDDSYPFGKKLYHIRAHNGTMHKCELRLSWVRSKLVD